MPLTPGTRLGAYDIVSQIGVGGMGEVYRATDTKLKREVAIKVLPASVAGDPERLARFQREAEVLASLNHPNIAHIYGLEGRVGQVGPVGQVGHDGPCLVLELVEGPTLADLITQGPIPITQALPIAKQIAEALEAAHERGIVHRDLKPANVKVRPDGTVKVLDFGLAKAMESGGPDGPRASSSASMSPTITTPAMTAAGMILGTAAYMSPEQAKGRPADRRSDVWAFGAVFYEMLTGKRAFAGEDVSETLADVMRVDPAWQALPADLSPTLVTFLKRCLEKDPRRRLGDIHDMRLALDGAFDTAARPVADPPGAPTPPRPLWKRALPLVGTAVVVAAAAWLAGRVSVPVEPHPLIRSRHLVPEGRILAPIGAQDIDIATDGRYFVYNGSGDRASRIYLRAMDDVDDRLLQTEGVPAGPFLSPDGRSLGYFDMNTSQLKRVSVDGGPSRVLATTAMLPSGAKWDADGTVLYALSDGIWQVSENGGTPERVIAAEAGERFYGPERLPGGEWILLTFARSTDPVDEAQIVAVSAATGERRVIVSGGHDGRYLPTGHIVYARGNVLYAVPFDTGSLTASADPVPVVDGVRYPGGNSAASFYAVAANGTLVYAPGRSVGQSGVLAWTGLDGRQEALDLPPGNYNHPRLSPDGRWLAFERPEGQGTDVWVYEVSGTRAMQRLTEGGKSRYPVWSRDSEHVVFQSDRDGDDGIFWQRTDGTALAERLTTAEPGTRHIPESWSRAEDRLAFSVQTGATTELWTWTLSDRTARRFGSVEASSLFNAAFSPDGRWLAYTQRGLTPGVWVALVSAPETRYQVGQSSDAAHHPLWSPDGGRLFYFANVTPMAVNVTTQPTLSLGRPEPLANLPINVTPQSELNHDIAPDGSRFVTFVPGGLGGDQTPDQVITVFNWFEELKRLAPAK